MAKQEYDWLEPWWHLLQLGNILLKDALGLIAFVALTQLVEIIIAHISLYPMEWSFWVVTVSLWQIINYGNLFIVAAFFFVTFRHIVKWAKQ